MKLNMEKLVIGGMVVLLVGVVIWMSLLSAPARGPELVVKEAAQAKLGACLKDSGIKFYGASWCPHCQRMKALLGENAYKPIYVECATPDGGQTQACKDAKIEGYPTWMFKDGSTTTGEKPLNFFTEKTGCTIPSEYSDQPTVAPGTSPSLAPASEINGTPKELQPGGASSAK